VPGRVLPAWAWMASRSGARLV